METQAPSGALDHRIKWLQDHNLSIILRVFEPKDNLWNVTDVLNLQRADCNELLGDIQGLIVYNRIQAAKGHPRSNGSPPPSFRPIQPPLQQSPLQQTRGLSPQQQLRQMDTPVVTVGQPPPYQLGGLPFNFPMDRGPSGEVQAALMAAVENNDVADVTSILTTFPSLVNCEGEDGQSPLFGAKSPEMLQLLLDRRADVHHRSKDGDTPVFLHAEAELVSMLCNAGADINAKNMLGETPLGNALEMKDLSLVHTLLSLGANPNLIAKQPLEFAAKHCPEAVPTLLGVMESALTNPGAFEFHNGSLDKSWSVEAGLERGRVLSDSDYPALGVHLPSGHDEDNPWIEVKRDKQNPLGTLQQREARPGTIAVCPFNSGHRMAPSSLARHKFTCSDRPKSRGGNGLEHGGVVVGEMVTCSFNQGHCVPRATLAVHERRCPDNPQAKLVQCPHTSDHRHRFAAEDMPAHAEKCRARPVVCPYDPRHKMPFQALQKHKEVCLARPA